MSPSYSRTPPVRHNRPGWVRGFVAQPNRWRAIFALVDRRTPTFRKRVDRNREAVIDTIERLIRSINGDDVDVELLARSVFALMWDAGRPVLANPKRLPIEFTGRSIRTLVDQL